MKMEDDFRSEILTTVTEVVNRAGCPVLARFWLGRGREILGCPVLSPGLYDYAEAGWAGVSSAIASAPVRMQSGTPMPW